MEVLYILFLTLIASSVGTITGFGTSTILVPTLSLFYPLPETLLFVGIIHWFGDVWKMLFFKKGAIWKLVFLFGFSGILVSFIGALLSGTFPEYMLKKMLGGFLVLYVWFIWAKPKWSLPKTNTNALIGGALSGFFSGIFGVGGAIRSTFLSAYNLEKAVFIFTSGAIGLLIDSSRLAGYVSSGITLNHYKLFTLAAAVIVAFLGAYLAKSAVNKIPQDKFRLVVLYALFFVGFRYLFF